MLNVNINNRELFESQNSQIAEDNMPNENFATNQAHEPLPSTSYADESACTSPVLNTEVIRRRGMLRLSGKSVSTKNYMDNENLLQRLQDAKRKRSEQFTRTISNLENSNISFDEFGESVRALDKACKNVEPVLIKHAPPMPLRLVPFAVLQNHSLQDENLRKNYQSAVHLSFEEDNEEDMFADMKDDTEDAIADMKDLKDNTENMDEFSCWNYKSAESPTSFHGFSSKESYHSTNVATQCDERRKIEERDNQAVEEEEKFFHGFSLADINESVAIERRGSFLLKKYYSDSELGNSLSNLKNIAMDVDSEEKINPKKSIEESQAGLFTSKGMIEKLPNECRMDNFLDSESSPKLGISSKTESFSTVKESDNVTLETLPSNTRASLSKQIENITKNLQLNNSKLEVCQNISESCSKISHPQSSKLSMSSKTESFSTVKESDNVTLETLPSNTRASMSKQIENITKNLQLNDSKLEVCQKISESCSKISHPQAHCGFATASGCPISISEKALEKAKITLIDEIDSKMEEKLDDLNVDDFPESANWSNFVPQNVCGFSTAGGRSINVSETAITKAQQIYKEVERSELGKIEMTENPSKIAVKEEKKKPEVSLGFKTARGGELKISKDALSKAQAHFEEIGDSIIDNSNEKNSKLDSLNSTVSTFKNSTTRCGFATASGCAIKITEQALAMAQKNFAPDFHETEPLDINDFVDPIEESESSKKEKIQDFVDPIEESENSKKRKFEEIDDDTPLRRDPPWKRKKNRYDSDLQGRKLFVEDSTKKESSVNDFKIVGSNDIEMTFSPVGSSILHEPEKILISEEIDASAAAFLEDEERSNKEATNHFSIDDTAVRTRSLPQESLNLVGIVDRSKINESSSIPPKRARSGPEKIETCNNGPAHKKFRQGKEKDEKKIEGKEITTSEIQHESIPDDLTFDSQFSQEFHQSQVMNTFIMETMKIMEARLAMTSKQDEVIRTKRRTKPQAQDGSLYQLRISHKDSRISWKELTDEAAPEPRENSGKSRGSHVTSVTSILAASYKFCCTDFYGGKDVRINVEGIKVGDDAFLILDEKNCAGPREFERAFLASPGVDPNLVPTGWVKNHYRWIVWKLASMDRVKFGNKCLPRMLTPNRVMLELKYRYDREIYRSQWPPLRRILEKNEDSCARIVFCVASISEEVDKTLAKGSSTPSSLGSTMYKMKLTDGWYSISASIDSAMVNCIKSGKVKEGTKLVTFGAKAIHLDQGCSALEIPDSVTLRIHTNSTRRVKWDTKLDYCYSNRGPMTLSLKSVKPNGGAICKMIVAVARLYPILYREKLPDGQFVFRNERCDEEAARVHEARCQSKIEEIYANASIDFQNCSQSREKEDEVRQNIASKLSECLPPPRDVTPVMKVRIAEGEISAMMTVYSTDRETAQIFVEGSSIVIYNAFASGQRSNELNVTAGRSTFFNPEGSRRIVYPERIFTSLMDIGEAGFNPVYGEFDTIGIVASTGAAPHGMKNFETVNLASPRSGEDGISDFLSVLFWQGVSTHGYSKILTVGTLVACSNLEWRRNTSRSIPTAYCTERSIFTKNPRKNHLSQPFESLRDQIKDPLAYAASSALIIQEEIAKKSALRTPGSGTSWRTGMTSNNSTSGWSPRDLSTSNDGNSTPVNVSRKSTTMRRIEKLEVYGQPPKLPQIVINNSSPQVLADFRSPVLTPVTKS